MNIDCAQHKLIPNKGMQRFSKNAKSNHLKQKKLIKSN
jgi:hypothetical protein